MPKLHESLILASALIFLGVSLWYGQSKQPIEGLSLGAPTLSYQKSLLPITNSLYDIGSSTPSLLWNRLFANYASTTALSTTNLNITGTCVGCASGGVSVFGDLSDVATSSDATGDLYYLNSSGQITNLGVSTNGQILNLSSGIPAWGATTTFSGGLTYSGGGVTADLGTSVTLTSEVDGVLPVANGGTGWGTINANTLLLGNGTGAFSTTTAGTNGQTLALISGVPTWVGTTTLSTISGILDISSQTNIATTSVTIGTGLSYSGTFGSVIDGGAGTLTTTLGTAVDLQSELTDNFTDSSVLFWGTTAVSEDNSAFSYNSTLDRLTVTYASTTAISGTDANFSTLTGAIQTASQSLITSLGTLTGLTSTGVIDFGGATSFEITNGTSPTVDADGEIAIDTTVGQLKYFSSLGGGINILTGTTSPAVNLASTDTDQAGLKFSTGTTTFNMKNSPEPFTLIGFYCKATSTAATTQIGNIQFSDASNNFTESAKCDTSGVFTRTTTNNTFTVWEDFLIHASSTGGDVDRMTITTVINKTAQ